MLARRGEVVRVDKDLWFASAAVDTARDVLLAQLESAGEVTLAGFRDAAGADAATRRPSSSTSTGRA